MALPENIAVRYTEEEAEYLSMRPVVRQNFRPAELVDMILSVAGKDRRRIRQILRAGTLVYHSYRYWWEGLDMEEQELDSLLSAYPDADPSRVFHAKDCAAILLESSGPTPRHTLELTSKAASRRRLFRSRSLWDALLQAGNRGNLFYLEYSYARRADLYEVALDHVQAATLAREAQRLAPRSLRAPLRYLVEMSRMVFICPRSQNPE